MTRLEPLPIDTHPELAEQFATFERILGFVPNDTVGTDLEDGPRRFG
jgi:hypothetical protein